MSTPAADTRRRRLLLDSPSAPLLLWLASRALIFSVAVVSQLLQPGNGLLSLSDWPIRILFNWDSGYFLQIASSGYPDHVDPTEAFFPGYPLSSRLLAVIIQPVGSSVMTLTAAMFVVVQLSSLVAAVLVWSLSRREHGPRAATISTALVILGPYALFLAASYSEAFFLALAVGAWLAARRGRWWVAGLLGACASFTRINGLFLVAALIVMFLSDRGPLARPLVIPRLLTVAAGFLGTAVYLLFLWLRTGSPTAWWQAQTEGWNRGLHWPWMTFYETAGRALYASTLDRRIQYGLDLAFASFLVLAIVWFIRRRAWPELTLTGLTGLSLMTSFSYLSLARNTSTLFPIAVELGAYAAGSTSGRNRVLIVGALGVALLIFNVHQFTLGLWAD